MNLLPAKLMATAERAQVQFDGNTFDLPDWPLHALAAHANHEVTLGIRPEDLHERPVVPMPLLRALVRVIEPLGAETILVLTAGDQNHQLLARVGRETSFRVGEMAEIGVDVNAIHLFEATTGKAIFRPGR